MAWDGWKSGLSFILGLLLVVVGGVPLLEGMTGYGLPAFLSSMMGTLGPYLMFVAGMYLLIDSYEEWGEWYFWPTAIVGLLGFLGGLVIVLSSFGVVDVGLPNLSLTAYYVVFVLEGVLLIMGSFLQL